jgi:hypothetical protein
MGLPFSTTNTANTLTGLLPTSYEAAVMTGAKAAKPARAVLKVLDPQAGKAALVSGGV